METIGDAYMVVGGVPIPTDTHAERVANFALGMRIAAREVTSPITGQPIQVCVCLQLALCKYKLCVLFYHMIGQINWLIVDLDKSRPAHRFSFSWCCR